MPFFLQAFYAQFRYIHLNYFQSFGSIEICRSMTCIDNLVKICKIAVIVSGSMLPDL